jgi:hypothetical protein
MGKQTSERIKKTLGVLLVVFFIVSATVASVSACNKGKSSGTGGKIISDPPSTRGFDRDFDRGFDRDFDRGFDRDFDRGFDRDFDRGF